MSVFGDPAWELVLEAYIATIERRCVALSDLGNKLRRPVSVLTRLAVILEAEGYVEHSRTNNDQDAGAVQLTPDAITWCEQCLDLKPGNGD
jgi:DNA-binding MarR family transcriptional regulator